VISLRAWTIGDRFSAEAVILFVLATASRPTLKPTQTNIQWVPGSLSPGVKRPGREAHTSSPFSSEVKNTWSYTTTLAYVFVSWWIFKHGNIFTFYLRPNPTGHASWYGRTGLADLCHYPVGLTPLYYTFHSLLFQESTRSLVRWESVCNTFLMGSVATHCFHRHASVSPSFFRL
jgi:hypothetical protein